jgi:hypothetical protein
VHVSGARGAAPSPHYKVGVAAADGYKATATLIVSGIDALEKAAAVADAILVRSARLLALPRNKHLGGAFAKHDTRVELLGSEDTFGPHASAGARATREIVLRIGVRHQNRKAIALFAREVAPAATGMAPGLCGDGSGRARAKPCIVYYSCLVDKSLVPASVVVGASAKRVVAPLPLLAPPSLSASASLPLPMADSLPLHNGQYGNDGGGGGGGSSNGELEIVPLVRVCLGRSGDKGDSANVGLIARKAEYFPYLRRLMTAPVVRARLSHLMHARGAVYAYELPGISALNFVCTRALGGGGSSSLHVDSQGKSYAQKVLSMDVLVPRAWGLGERARSRL